MLNRRGRKAFGLLVACLTGLLPPAFAAQADAQTGAQSLKMDQVVQALKDEVLEFNREAQAIENEALLPAHARVSVYLGVKVSGLLLDEVSVMIDEQRPVVYRYDAADARALLNETSLQRILRTPIANGAHRIRVSFTGHFADDKAEDPPVIDSFEAVFDKGLQEAELELTIARERRIAGKPKISMKQWRAGR
ncbi:MAG TPA: hypothetical protein VGE57_04185 [Solimonas sp.]